MGNGKIVMDKLLEVAKVVVAQLALLVNAQVITSPFDRALSEYVEELEPTLLPFFFH